MHIHEDETCITKAACLTRRRKWNLSAGFRGWTEFHYRHTFHKPHDSLPLSNMHITWPHLQPTSNPSHTNCYVTCEGKKCHINNTSVMSTVYHTHRDINDSISAEIFSTIQQDWLSYICNSDLLKLYLFIVTKLRSKYTSPILTFDIVRKIC